MSNAVKKNLPASVRQRLLMTSQQRGEPFDLVLTQYAIERLLYRLSQSRFADRFLLKGAMLFRIWTENSQLAAHPTNHFAHPGLSSRRDCEGDEGLCFEVADGRNLSFGDVFDHACHPRFSATYRNGAKAPFRRACVPVFSVADFWIVDWSDSC
jgi:hypothetical protein